LTLVSCDSVGNARDCGREMKNPATKAIMLWIADAKRGNIGTDCKGRISN